MKMKFAILAASASLAFSTPVYAQDAEEMPSAEEMAAIGDAFGGMFGTAEPLTPEQEARLPAATAIVGQIMPDGSFAKMMDETMEPMMGGIMGQMGEIPLAQLAALGGLPETEVMAMGDGTIGEIMAILDPAFEQRNEAITQVTLSMVTRLVERIEPSYQAGLARAYATRFSADEMADIQTFFSTPTGSRYAGESMMIYADPQVMAAMNEMMPAMFEMLPDIMAEMAAAQEGLPPVRTFDQLNAADQAKLAELLGTDVETMAENAEDAAATEGVMQPAM